MNNIPLDKFNPKYNGFHDTALIFFILNHPCSLKVV